MARDGGASLGVGVRGVVGLLDDHSVPDIPGELNPRITSRRLVDNDEYFKLPLSDHPEIQQMID